MGCCNPLPVSGEAFITEIFQDPNFKLKDYSYNHLLNFLSDFLINQELHKKYIEEQIIPSFYHHHNYENKKYYQSFFKEILNNLQDRNNMYNVLIYFYPFIEHNNENVENNLYSIFIYIGGKGYLNLKLMIECIENYIKFVTITITKIVLKNTNDELMQNSLNDLLNRVYTEKNIQNFLATNLFELLKLYGQNDIIPVETFIEYTRRLDLGYFHELRNRIYIYFFAR